MQNIFWNKCVKNQWPKENFTQKRSCRLSSQHIRWLSCCSQWPCGLMLVLRFTVRTMGSWVRCLVGMDIWRRLYMSSYVGADIFKTCKPRKKFGVVIEIQIRSHVHCTLPAVHLCSDVRTVSILITLEAWRACWPSGIKFHDTALFSKPHDATCQTTMNSSRMVVHLFYVFIYDLFNDNG
jgi:hypothetical protein